VYQERVEEAVQRELGRIEWQIELEAVTQSTLREQLERERERADRLEEELRGAAAVVEAHLRTVTGQRPRSKALYNKPP
jgi:hypothetical protein